MNENQLIEKVAKDLCHKGGNCLTCSAANGFECTAKKYARQIVELGYGVPDGHGDFLYIERK